MSAGRQWPRVVVADIGVDVAVTRDADGQVELYLSPNQSFENAVLMVSRRLPSMHPDQVRMLVRHYLPEAAGFDTVTGNTSPGRRRRPAAPQPPATWRSRVRWPVAAAALLATLATSSVFIATGQLRSLTEPEELMPLTMFEGESMVALEEALQVDCTGITQLTARCTDALEDRSVYLEVGLAPDGLLMWVTSGSARTNACIFLDPDRADAWEKAGAVTRPNYSRDGVVAAWGNDPEMSARLSQALVAVEEEHDLRGRVGKLRLAVAD